MYVKVWLGVPAGMGAGACMDLGKRLSLGPEPRHSGCTDATFHAGPVPLVQPVWLRLHHFLEGNNCIAVL